VFGRELAENPTFVTALEKAYAKLE
jgi:hypothetical protein